MDSIEVSFLIYFIFINRLDLTVIGIIINTITGIILVYNYYEDNLFEDPLINT